jgi:hypothetical protein
MIMGKYTKNIFSGLHINSRKNVMNYFKEETDNYRILMEEKGKLNPFKEDWGKGRPSLEKLIRRDFAGLWFADNLPTHGLLGAILNPTMPMSKGEDGKVRIKFIQRGTELLPKNPDGSVNRW